jgi:hypothetical protein
MEFFSSEHFPAKWKPVSRKKMRLTEQAEYGRECAAGQPGAASTAINLANAHENPAPRYCNHEL